MAVDEQHLEDVDDLDFEPAPDESKSATIFDALKAQRAKVADERTLDVDVPGWANMLVLRLGPISADAQTRIVERGQRRKQAGHLSNVDFLIAAFRGIYGRTSPTDPELTLLVDEDGDPHRFDTALTERLGLGPVRTAREAVELLFSKANSPTFALGAVTNEWGEWASDASEEVDEEFLGES